MEKLKNALMLPINNVLLINMKLYIPGMVYISVKKITSMKSKVPME